MTYFLPAKDAKARYKKRPRPAKITIVALVLVTTLVALLPLFMDLTTLRFLGFLAGANFLALQFGMLLSLLKSSTARRILQIRDNRFAD